jgi:hypothetical protein
MKRLIALLLLSASVGFAEQATLSANTVLRTADSLVILKAGTVVQILARNEKTVSVKVGNKTGLIAVSALQQVADDNDMMSAPQTHVAASAAAPTPAPAPAPVAADTTPTHTPGTQVIPHNAQSMYGKMVEKAANAAGSHEKTLVQPTDEILDGK